MNLDDAFFPALVRASNEMGVPADWPLLLMYLESRLDPSAKNALGYVGLNQMSSSNLARLGIDPDDYRTWPASVQMTRVVGPFLKGQIAWLGKFPRTAGVLYALNFYPASVKSRGDDPSSVLVDSNAPSDYERRAYAKNKGLDIDKDGTITIEDLDTFLEALSKQAPYKEARARLGAPLKPLTSSSSGAWKPIAGAAVIVVLGGALAWAIRDKHVLHTAMENPAKSMRVQSLLFPRPAWTPSRAKKWARAHGYRAGKVDLTPAYVRLRQADPERFRVIRTIDFGKGIRAVVGR